MRCEAGRFEHCEEGCEIEISPQAGGGEFGRSFYISSDRFINTRPSPESVRLKLL